MSFKKHDDKDGWIINDNIHLGEYMISNNLLGGGGFKYVSNVYPLKLGKVKPILTVAYFSKGLVKNHQRSVSDSTSELGVSTNNGTPKSYFHRPFWGTPIFGNTQFN